ncbi:MAG: AAA family ATPase [bacterium]
MSRVIAIANQKGGVGKTTTAINLSACLAEQGYETLLIDIDPQANATSGLGVDPNDVDLTIYEALIEEIDIEDALLETTVTDLDLVPSHIRLTGAELEMVSMIGREKKLQQSIESVREEYDFVLVDCPPSLGLLTLNTLTAADSVMIPIQCEYYALEGLGKLLNTIRLVQKHLNPNLYIEGVLLTMYDGRLNLSKQVAEEAARYFGDKVYTTKIMRNVRLGEAPSFGKPIIQYDILSTGAENYISLTKEVIAHGKESARQRA